MLANQDDKQEYEDLMNDVGLGVENIQKEEFTYDRKTGLPVITVWYDEYDD